MNSWAYTKIDTAVKSRLVGCADNADQKCIQNFRGKTLRKSAISKTAELNGNTLTLLIRMRVQTRAILCHDGYCDQLRTQNFSLGGGADPEAIYI